MQLVEQLEADSPLPEPTRRLDLLAGSWRVLFSTVTVTVRAARGWLAARALCGSAPWL